MGKNKAWWVPWAFLALPLVLYLFWVILPVFQSLAYSFTKRDSIIFGTQWVGFRNFARLFTDGQFWLAIRNNMVWLVFFVGIPVPLGLFVAMLFNTERRGNRLYKTLFYLPMTLSFAIIGTMWMWIYNPDFGALNTFLRMVGLDSVAVQWLGDKRYMTGALVAVGVWRQVPYVMILYLAGLKGVPGELVEAAMIDGASWWQRFRHVVIPMLAPATVVAMTISVIDSLRSFDIVYVMTNTKARAAEVLASYMYSSTFHYSDYGYGSAIAVMQFLITLGFILVYVNNVLKNEIER
ncbi:MAG: sugar ABC transporter permease [Spirochaetes bacterium]|nr:sugar ABC transporter permease [Spirochaetota bacterium]